MSIAIVSNGNNDLEQHNRHKGLTPMHSITIINKDLEYDLTCDKLYNTYKMPLISSSCKVPLKTRPHSEKVQ